jgi:hypothetical protein
MEWGLHATGPQASGWQVPLKQVSPKVHVTPTHERCRQPSNVQTWSGPHVASLQFRLRQALAAQPVPAWQALPQMPQL